jgi:hypothetical protein
MVYIKRILLILIFASTAIAGADAADKKAETDKDRGVLGEAVHQGEKAIKNVDKGVQKEADNLRKAIKGDKKKSKALKKDDKKESAPK